MTANRLENTADLAQERVQVAVQVSSPSSRDAEVAKVLSDAAGGEGVFASSWRVDRATPEA